MATSSRPWTQLSAAIAIVGALIHVAAIPAGPAWSAYFGAPVGALVVAAIFWGLAGFGFALGVKTARRPALY
jgi:hypothetical protein